MFINYLTNRAQYLLLFIFLQTLHPVNLIGNNEWSKIMFGIAQQSAKSAVPEFTDAYGVAFRDINNDGLADIYIVCFRNLNRLFINQGANKPFQDGTILSGLGGNLAPRGIENLELGASIVDYDNNGIKDVLITGWGVTSNIFQQQSDLKFSNVTNNAGFVLPFSGNAGIWADIDLDGDLDLFISDEHYENHLFVQEKPGLFRDLAADYGVNAKDKSQGAAFGDVNNDGYPDLYVCNWSAPDIFYRNVEGKKFQRVIIPLKHLKSSLNSNGVSFGDIDNDGDPDILVTDRQGQSSIYRNDLKPDNDNWQFTDITTSSGLDNIYPSYSGIIADLNNDGQQDIFFTNIGPNLLYINNGDEQFRLAYKDEISKNSSLQHYSTGAAVADFDNDGDLDLFVSSKDTNSVLYTNPINNIQFIRIKLEGIQSNREAIGAKVWLYEQDDKENPETLIGYREISGGSGYLSISETVVHFGVPVNRYYYIKVRFPSGKEIIRSNVIQGEVIYIAEYQGIVKSLLLTRQYTERLVRNSAFWINLLLFLILAGVIGGFISIAIYRYNWTNRQTAAFIVIILSVLYLLFWLFSGKDLRAIFVLQIAFVVVIIGFLAGFMENIRQLKMKRYGYRKTLQHFSEQLILIKNNSKLYNQLVTTTQKTMGARFCILFELINNHFKPRFTSGSTLTTITQFELSDEQRKVLLNNNSIETNLLRKYFPMFAEKGGCIMVPIGQQDKLIALLLLGEMEKRKSYKSEDITLLQILANQAALAIENNKFIEEAKELTRKVTEANIREKYIAELENKNTKLEQLYKELQDTQAQLVQSEKMSSLGQLVAGIAHELNNPIGYIYANMKELQKYLLVLKGIGKSEDSYSNQKQNLDFIQSDLDNLISDSVEGSKRVKEIIENLRNFSRLDEAEFKKVNIHDGLDSTLSLLNNEIGSAIKINKNYGDLPKIYCMPGSLNQVFMNLLMNAIQSIKESGNIWITTRSSSENVFVEIRDDGLGISETDLNKVFDPFFTTKAIGKGTGLGLSISYGIIRKHGGTLSVKSEKGKGSVFTIKLPVRKND